MIFGKFSGENSERVIDKLIVIAKPLWGIKENMQSRYVTMIGNFKIS